MRTTRWQEVLLEHEEVLVGLASVPTQLLVHLIETPHKFHVRIFGEFQLDWRQTFCFENDSDVIRRVGRLRYFVALRSAVCIACDNLAHFVYLEYPLADLLCDSVYNFHRSSARVEAQTACLYGRRKPTSIFDLPSE